MGLIKSLAGLAGLAVGGPMGAALAVGATEAAQGGDFKDILGGGLKGSLAVRQSTRALAH